MIFRRDTIPTFFKAVRRAVAALFAHEQVVATPYIQQARKDRCLVCPNYEPASDQCRICTCVVALKTMIATESCPTGAWGRQGRFTTGL